MQSSSVNVSSRLVITKSRLAKIWVSTMVVLLLYLWEGLPMSIIGIPRYYGRQIAAAFIVICFLFYMKNKLTKGIKFDKWEKIALLILSLTFIVSYISNTFIYPQGLSGWVPALYLLCPLLLVFVCRYFKATPESIIAGLVFAGVSGAILVVINNFYHLPFMDEYERVTTVGLAERRIVFLKTEAAIAATIIATRLLSVKSFGWWFKNLLMAIPLFYSLIFVSESRLAIAAALIGVAIFSLFVLRGIHRLRYIIAGLVFVVFAAPVVLDKYIEQISSNALEDDASVVFRKLEMEHFNGYFQETYGIGFGVMSTGVGKNNILAYSAHDAGHFYGSGDYGMGLADVGILAALYQFGWMGLILILYTTFSAGIYMLKIGRTHKTALDTGAVGSVMIAYMLSPLPMNFFTLDSTAVGGGLLLALCGACIRQYDHGVTCFSNKKEVGNANGWPL